MISKKKNQITAELKNDTRVITGKVRLSYVHLFEPWVGDSGEPKYSTAVLIDKNDESTLSCIEQAVENAIEKGKSKLAVNGKIPKNLKTPLRDGDDERPDQDEYAGMFFLNASRKSRPEIVNRSGAFITDPYDVDGTPTVYSGCYAQTSLEFFAFNTSGNRGIACGLGNVRKLEDGEPLDGSCGAKEDFGELDDEDDTPKRAKKPSRRSYDDDDDEDDLPKRLKKQSRYYDDDEDEEL